MRSHESLNTLFFIVLGLSVIGLCALGCSSEEELKEVFWNECSSDADCAQGRCLTSDKGQRVCVVLDGDVFGGETSDATDPAGLAACGTAQNPMYCAEDQICCDGTCVLPSTDNANCGACGVSCASNEVCSDGACVCASVVCDSSEICCDVNGALSCVNPFTDKENCGGCGSVCSEAQNESCLLGQCGCLKLEGTDPFPGDPMTLELCAPGSECCPPRAEFPNEARGCVDLNTPEDCGSCGNKCGDGEQCINGQCTCGQTVPSNPDGLGAVCGSGEACCFSPNGQQVCRPEADCRCGGTLNTTTGRIEGGTTCLGVQICCYADIPGLPALLEPTCVDPTRDAENCGGCVHNSEDIADANTQFRCQPGQICGRNFEYSLGRPPEEQHAEGIYIGQCELTCALDRVKCPGGLDETGVPYTSDRQSCIDPLSSREFCGALPRRDDASTAGQCSISDPVTFGDLRNFRGVPCGAGEVCRAKLLCPNPAPFPGTEADGVTPCDPASHYYYDVATSTDADFPAGTLLPSGAVFDPSADANAYRENIYLRAVCDTLP